jgi:DNA repair protein RadA/Sms
MSTEPTGLLGIGGFEYEQVSLSDSLAWLKHRIEKFVVGGIYLIAGQPGIGRSTLGIQIALDLGKRGQRSLYILTEQSADDLAKRARRMCSEWPVLDREKALANISPEESIYDIEILPNFLSHQVLSSSGKYHGAKLIVVDSIQVTASPPVPRENTSRSTSSADSAAQMESPFFSSHM